MKKRHGRYIKYVETIPEQEFKRIRVFQSILNALGDNDGTRVENRNHNTRFVIDRNGELEERDISEIVSKPEDFFNAFSEYNTVMGVKIFWSDGEMEYGFKSWCNKAIVHRKNSELVSIYTKDGVFNEETQEIEDIFDLEDDCQVPAWILKLMPGWNERIKDAILKGDTSVETKCVSLDDWKVVWDTINSKYTTNLAKCKEVTIYGKRTIRAVGAEFNQSTWFTHVDSSWKNEVCEDTFGVSSQMLDKDAIKVFCYSYLKSIYRDRTSMRKVYDLFPVSSLLMIKRRRWTGGGFGDFNETEIWNSLDETCKGNV